MECSESYGMLPCSTRVVGNLYLLATYGFVMLKAAQLLSDGSELLLTVLNPGIIGGLLLPILGSLPDALLILVSGLGGNQETAQSQVSVGMGLLAGSTIMLLTLLWGSCLFVGRCDLYPVHADLVAKDRTLTRGFSLTGTGITTDSQTTVSAWIMIATVFPYVLAQLPHLLHRPSYGHPFAVVSCVISFCALFIYCGYQVVSPWIQQRRIYFARHRYRQSHALHRVHVYSTQQAWGGLFLEDGVTPNKDALLRIFGYFDENDDGHLSERELRGLIVGLGITHETHLPEEEEVQNWLKEFDTSRDDKVSQEEFVAAITKWMRSFRAKDSHRDNPEYWDSQAKDARSSLDALLEQQPDDDEDDDEQDKQNPKQVILKASAFILAGAVIAGVFADPLVDAIDNFSKASKIPSFFVAFVATPLATNSSEAVSSLMFAARKKKRNISMTYSQIYGAVTLNNTLCLGVFLAIVCARRLVWDFSSEVTVIAVVTFLVGLLGGKRTTFRLYMALAVLSLYPLSIALVAGLDYGLGWH
ncbi:sodium/calcium exchanger NCL1 [Selaginella moellendorffii]|nr:sodium/calcium exchanger NCL1 [Selaginella moellendorffii]|eukprot:XP_002974272.2 sodium/calcium exchanger NCL1 [Selaginella moellendorffii]